jgi:hypothetical protein
MDMDDATYELEAGRSRARADFVGKEGNYWLKRLQPELEKLPDGTVVVINIVNGEYVTASSPLEGMDKFDQKFGHNQTFGFSHRIGRPTYLSGLAAING